MGTGRRRWSWYRGRKARHTAVLGLYHAASNVSNNAWIELFVDRIVSGVPRCALLFASTRATVFGPVLFHELGHHIYASMRPEHREREDTADAWARRLLTTHLRRRHATTWALLRPVAWSIRMANRARRLRHRFM